MADNLKVFGTTYYDVQGQKFTDLDGNEKTYIRPVGTKQIAQNGTADVKKYEFAEVAVPASAVDEGTKQITQNGNGQDVVGYAAVDVNVPGIVPAGTKQINQNGTHDVTQYASAEVNVPNTYAASDEGKVVHNGALTAQTSGTATENGTVDTTLIDSLTVNVSGGGGSITKVADGTFVGAGSSTVDIFVGKKCPQSDFIFNIWVDNGTQITPNAGTDRVSVINQIIVNKRFSIVDLTGADGNKTMANQMTYPTYNGSEYINRTPPSSVSNVSYVRMTTTVAEGNYFSYIKKDSNGFTFHFGKNAQYFYQNGITCKWELLYFGSDPTSDIVEVA